MAEYSNSITASNTLELYDASNIDSLVWPNDEEGEYARRFLLPLVKKGAQHYIANINTQLMVLKLDQLILPISINEVGFRNSYVCSPYGQYVTCAKEALHYFKPQVLQKPLQLIVKGMGFCLNKGKIDRSVIVNNWLFSTDLYPHISHDQIERIRDFLISKFPYHAILFRSVGASHVSRMYKSLKHSRFDLILSRQVFLFSGDNEENFRSRILKSDLKLLKETDYEVVTQSALTDEDLERIHALYEAVYLDRHSKSNPQLTKEYIELLFTNRSLEFLLLKKEGRIDAVAGFFCRNGVMTAPFLGYDTSLPQENKLYRLTSTALFVEARKRKMLFHLSSGATFYKKIRKAEPSFEYLAVYRRHLPLRRQIPWQVLKGILNSVGAFSMKFYEG